MSTQDPWINEDDDEANETATAPQAIAQPAAAKPDVAPDPTIPTLVLPKPEMPEEKPVREAVQSLGEQADQPHIHKDPVASRRLQGALRRMAAASSKQERKFLLGKLAQLTTGINGAEQVPKAPEIDLNAVNVARAKHLGSAEQRRNEEHARLTEAEKTNTPFGYNRSRPTMIGLAGFVESEPVKAQLNELVRAERHYKIQYLENFLWVNPRDREQEHKIALYSHPSDDALEQICAEAHVINGRHFNTIAAAKVGKLAAFFDAEVKPRLEALLNSAIAFVEAQKENATQSEAEFFARFGMASEATGVSKRYATTIVELKRRLHVHNNPPAMPIMPTNHGSRISHPDGTLLQHVFGIELLPPAN